MPDGQPIQSFKSLDIWVPIAQRPTVRDGLIQAASSPWSHNSKQEIEINGLPNNPKYLVFDRQSNDHNEEVALFLVETENGFSLANIIPKEIDRLAHSQYNAIVDDFYQKIVHPIQVNLNLKVKLSRELIEISDIFSEKAVSELRKFSRTANRVTGIAHPNDEAIWLKFVIKAFESAAEPESAQYLQRWLVEAEGWSEDVSRELSRHYEVGLRLLKKFREGR